MPSRYLHRTILHCVAPALVAGVLAACGGRGPLDTDIESYDSPDAAGLTRPGDDEIETGGDSGTTPTRPLDAGPGSKEGGAPGSPGSPGSPGTPGSPGLPGLLGLSPDAGGIVGCFACAEDSCGTQVNACVGSSACVEEGTCDLMCLGGGTTGGGLAGGGLAGGGMAGGGMAGLGGLNLQCFQSCTKDQMASQELLAALTCTFGSCGSQCLSALGGAGGGLGGLGGGGLGGLGGALGGLGGLGGVGPLGAATAAGQ
jgi:predicted small lipoprotein YifL